MNHPEAGLKKLSGSACLTKNYKHIKKRPSILISICMKGRIAVFLFSKGSVICILCGTWRIDDGCVHNGAALHHMTGLHHDAVDGIEK